MEINKYPDGSSYVDVSSLTPNKKLVFRINSYEDLWHLNQLVDAYNHYFNQPPTIVIPNLIDAQADRRFVVTQSSGLKLVCKFLNGINAKFKIFHPHNPEVVEALMDNVEIIDNSKFIEIVLHEYYLKGGVPKRTIDNLILTSSDAGGFKPLIKLCNKIGWQGETASASKSREGSNLIQQLPRENFDGKDILIIDDICVYGGTFKGLAKMLRERNCGKLYLAVSHMTVQNLGGDPVTNYFDKVFTTNSKFDTYQHTDGQGYDKICGVSPDNLKIINIF